MAGNLCEREIFTSIIHSNVDEMNRTTSQGMPPSQLSNLEGHVIPRMFEPGFVILSYIISYVGAWTTLELINRRTSTRGLHNWLTLSGAALSLGGVSTWCMHFIGNRAIVLGKGEPELQIVYSGGYTTLSFFLPVLVVLVAFGTVGANDEKLSIPRVVLGGILVGLGFCAMHYVGQAGIANYDSIYSFPYVIGAAFIAVSASIGTLTLFFMFRSAWRGAWWKNALCGILLSSAVSGMHWLASLGTQYRLRKITSSQRSNVGNFAVIVIIVLSVAGCLCLVLFALLAQRRAIKAGKRAQQIVLAAMVFDHDGKLLVSPEGLLPLRKITNEWLERTMNDVFNISHPVFLWMYRTSRYWSGVSNLIYSMKHHVRHTGLRARLGSSTDGKLVNDEGTPIEDYSLIFRELFCVTAAELASDLNQPIEKMGILYDEIINTGYVSKSNKGGKGKKSEATITSSVVDLEREGAGLATVGKGLLLFLVSRVGRLEAEDLQAAGYRFANTNYVAPILALSLQLRLAALQRRIEIMREYATDPHMLEPGVHFAIFAVRASLGIGRHGFDVLARKDAKNQLPTMLIDVPKLGDWHLEYLKKMENMSVSQCVKFLFKAAKPNNPDKNEQEFAKHLLASLEALKGEISDPIFNDALLITKPFEAQCYGATHDSSPGMAQVLAFKIIVPIHGRAPGKKLEFVPLNFFKACQHIYKNSPDHVIFAKKTHREFEPLLNQDSAQHNRHSQKLRFGASFISTTSATRTQRNEAKMGDHMNILGDPLSLSQPELTARGQNRIKFWERRPRTPNRESEQNLFAQDFANMDKIGLDSDNQSVKSANINETNKSRDSKLLGVELTPMANGGNTRIATPPTNEEEEMTTYIDELFTITITTRQFQ